MAPDRAGQAWHTKRPWLTGQGVQLWPVSHLAEQRVHELFFAGSRAYAAAVALQTAHTGMPDSLYLPSVQVLQTTAPNADSCPGVQGVQAP